MTNGPTGVPIERIEKPPGWAREPARDGAPGQRLLLTLALMLGAVSGFVRGGTFASFTDTASSASNQFSTGVVNITTPTTAQFSFSNIVPGEKVTRAITVTNDGTLDLTYSVSSTLDSDPNGLGANVLKLAIKSGLSSAECTTPNFDSWTPLYGPDALLAGSNLFTGRALTSSSPVEVLCFQIKLLATADPTTYQGKSTTVTFTFSGQA